MGRDRDDRKRFVRLIVKNFVPSDGAEKVPRERERERGRARERGREGGKERERRAGEETQCEREEGGWGWESLPVCLDP